MGSAVGWHINYPDQRRSQTLAQHQTENVGSLRAEGHADANLTGTQCRCFRPGQPVAKRHPHRDFTTPSRGPGSKIGGSSVTRYTST